jgi:hypothetical protein
MTRDEWIQEMARLIKERDRADAMISNWQEKREAADAAIESLRMYNGNQATEQPAVEQEQVLA